MSKLTTTAAVTPEIVVGLDLSDRSAHYAMLDMASGELIEEGKLQLSAKGLARRFQGVERMRIALEAGGQSAWVSDLLASWGHEVLVANPRRVALISRSRHKTDRIDARMLARLARVDPGLLNPVHHRSQAAQADLSLVRARTALVRSRAQLVLHVRSTAKQFGLQLPRCSTPSFARKVRSEIPEPLHDSLLPLLDLIDTLSDTIREQGRQLEQLAREAYPKTELLLQVNGVGPVTALTYVLTLEDPYRFGRSRAVGAYLGLTPRIEQSGDSNPQLGITKHGDTYLRSLLVQCAHYILGPFGEPCDLRDFGMRIVARGGPRAKKRAVVAVARKLAVLLHHLWITGEVYEPRRREDELPGQEAA